MRRIWRLFRSGGKRNSSLYVYRMAEAIAEIKELPLAQVIEQTTENGKRLFGIV